MAEAVWGEGQDGGAPVWRFGVKDVMMEVRHDGSSQLLGVKEIMMEVRHDGGSHLR